MHVLGRFFFILVLFSALGSGPPAAAQLASWANSRAQAPFQLRFPITWEVLRSGFNTLDVALEAETYAEHWTLESTGSDTFLTSPRARVRVIGLQTLESTSAPFDTLLVKEADLAQLLGIQQRTSEDKERYLFIDLPIIETRSQQIVLTASPEYFISVSLLLNFY